MIYFDCSTIYPGIVQEIYFMDIFPDISRTFPGNMSGNIWKRRKHVEKLYMAVSGEPQPKVLTKIIDQYARVLPGNWPVRPEIISDNHAKTKKTWFFFGGGFYYVLLCFCYVLLCFCYAFAMFSLFSEAAISFFSPRSLRFGFRSLRGNPSAGCRSRRPSSPNPWAQTTSPYSPSQIPL